MPRNLDIKHCGIDCLVHNITQPILTSPCVNESRDFTLTGKSGSSLRYFRGTISLDLSFSLSTCCCCCSNTPVNLCNTQQIIVVMKWTNYQLSDRAVSCILFYCYGFGPAWANGVLACSKLKPWGRTGLIRGSQPFYPNCTQPSRVKLISSMSQLLGRVKT